jgi:hypothetical protein
LTGLCGTIYTKPFGLLEILAYQSLALHPPSRFTMKSEERHKLQQNELADYLAKTLEKLKPYQNAIFGVIILLLAVYFLTAWVRARSAGKLAEASTQFNLALDEAQGSGDTAALIAILKDYPDSPVAATAAVTAADIHLNNGCNSLMENKAKANKDLADAVDLYQKILPNLSNSFLIAQAKFGLARAKESLNEIPEAKKLYAEIVEKWPIGPFGVLSARRLESLKQPSTAEICDKIANYEPKPFKEDTLLPGGKSPLLDSQDMALPKEAPVYTPGSFGEKIGIKNEKKAEETPSGDGKPSTDQLPSENTTPTPAKPNEESKPAEETKPASSDPPAATPPAVPAPTDTPAPAQTPPPEKTPAPAEGK